MNQIIEEADDERNDKDGQQQENDGFAGMKAPANTSERKTKEYSDPAERRGYLLMDPAFAWMGEQLFFLENAMMNGRNAKETMNEVMPARIGLSIP